MRSLSTFARAAMIAFLFLVFSTALATLVATMARSDPAPSVSATRSRPTHRASKVRRAVPAERTSRRRTVLALRPSCSGEGKTVGVFAPLAAAGMVVGRDPETGRLGMPTPEQLRELSSMSPPDLNFSTEGLVEEHHPDGSVSIDLRGRFQQYSYVRTDAKGRLIFDCTDDYPTVLRAINGSSPAPPRAEEK